MTTVDKIDRPARSVLLKTGRADVDLGYDPAEEEALHLLLLTPEGCLRMRFTSKLALIHFMNTWL